MSVVASCFVFYIVSERKWYVNPFKPPLRRPVWWWRSRWGQRLRRLSIKLNVLVHALD